ncbi:MAG: aldehyde dehydrogenase family protein [Betaproteobacteria bacterium]|jgi:acyl-CoA reductase-like NAD-dependent aldehyde dehydrogenase|nr:aldehyde dehydrogenase family protein [Betaproteobacteria bacterium]
MPDLHKNLIGGEWVAGASITTNRNPSDVRDVIGEYAQADASETRAAIAAAGRAFPGWAAGSIQERSIILDRVGTELLARKDELGRLLSREEGKTLPEGIGEAARAGHIFKFFAGEVLRLTGDKVPSVRPGIDVEVTREPIGVVGLITPWNFPIAIPAWKIAPALAYGNTVVMKPADLVPGCAWALADILVRAGVPAGVFNLVMGRGSVVGEALVNDPGVAALSFTGSVGTGRAIAAKAVARMAKVQLEMGGKNPLVVLDDADLPTAVNAAVQGAYYSTGQRCTASSRLIVTAGIHDRFVAAMIDKLKTLKVDDALAAGTDIGPVVDPSQLEQDLQYIEIGKSEGAKLAAGGERLARENEGYYLSPALFTGAHNGMRIAREEIFGPVACVIRAKDYDEALALANDTEFGLCSGVVTTSLKHASHFKRHAQAGMVMVNLPTAGVDYHVPFGGRKGSSYGPREQGRYAVEFYTTVKTAYIAP